ncbi:protein translocase subunit SecF [Candidatus Roizmanbacteria bacterium CG22_combo_CG10-13_8_21_14_all_38_20]|uniref:Protein-export membrane protein SecF n=1 Tax=Candidatus Roizmanbacteria bacterium CG22_combo_CG10-13_8_21_14_all_38_20 TaxID=1974862 RepID=A0A2H0BTV6_9BACT|nr:protein translocase subunit SecF [Candidatus Microgenomates bacterium]PIP61061.1 MAG: protein translocase subunit SecF [Candidatus Roizmanbacteria bacterium CG22_combo_CG10-13_8_21_14_all_38_20]PJC30847.1 MAG: protein translocase subunit SecF [Candidatus Roizmanbacteria bacterium CG_4_9_14_0_2_um_filter_38_17]
MINWLQYKRIYFTASGILAGISILALVIWGLKPGIDFTGGTLIEVNNKEILTILNKNDINVQAVQDSGEKVLIKTDFIEQKKIALIREEIASVAGSIKIDRFETVGPTLGKELLNKTLTAAIIAVIGILAYLAWAFKNLKYGMAAIVALLHDTLILAGVFAVLGKFMLVEVDALFVTALLTTMSFSVHDTVVVFNRIRENSGDKNSKDITKVANSALTETMVRSINNSLTILFMLLAMILLGGETIRWFMVALLIGTVLGTYSSPFVAVPVLSLLLKKK